MKKLKAIVVEVTTEGFELSDGRFYPHPIPLEEDELPIDSLTLTILS